MWIFVFNPELFSTSFYFIFDVAWFFKLLVTTVSVKSSVIIFHLFLIPLFVLNQR